MLPDARHGIGLLAGRAAEIGVGSASWLVRSVIRPTGATSGTQPRKGASRALRLAYASPVSRSIHETRSSLSHLRRSSYSDDERRREDMAVVEARLARKRVYKARGRRRSEDRPVATGAPTELVVTNDEAHRFVHHPLSPADIKGLVALMPAEPGIDLLAVRLRTGRHEEAMRGKPDPLVGRPSNDTEGPVWAPTLLGLYRGLPKEIDLFGYVYDPTQLRAPQLQLVLLWLKQAHTLAHEVAHCWDDGARAGRDWSGIAIGRRTEAYAAKMANVWLVSHAVPYFRAKHRARAKVFEVWLAEELGVPISLDDVARDVDRELWGLAIGLAKLASTWGDTSALDARVAVAEQLHFTDEFAKAREVLQAVLDEEPRHVRAWALMGDVAVHERDWDRALAVTEAAINLAPGDPDVAEDRVDALVGAKRWDDAVTACHHTLGLASSKSGDWRRPGAAPVAALAAREPERVVASRHCVVPPLGAHQGVDAVLGDIGVAGGQVDGSLGDREQRSQFSLVDGDVAHEGPRSDMAGLFVQHRLEDLSGLGELVGEVELFCYRHAGVERRGVPPGRSQLGEADGEPPQFPVDIAGHVVKAYRYAQLFSEPYLEDLGARPVLGPEIGHRVGHEPNVRHFGGVGLGPAPDGDPAPVAPRPGAVVPAVGDLVGEGVGLLQPQQHQLQLGGPELGRVVDVAEQVDLFWEPPVEAEERWCPDRAFRVVGGPADQRVGLAPHGLLMAAGPQPDGQQVYPGLCGHEGDQALYVGRAEGMVDEAVGLVVGHHELGGGACRHWPVLGTAPASGLVDAFAC